MEGAQDGTFICVSYLEGTAWTETRPLALLVTNVYYVCVRYSHYNRWAPQA